MLASILKDRLYRALLIAFGMFGAATCLVPLFDVLGYELSVAVAVLVYVTGGVYIAVVLRNAPDDPSAICPGCVLEAAGILLAIPLLLSILNALRVTNCAWSDGLAFYLLIPAVTAVLMAFYALMAATLSVRPLVAVALWYAGGALEVASRLRGIYVEPQTFFFSHVIGWFPGPIYDEALRATWPLAAFRATTACLALVFLGAVFIARGRLRSPGGWTVAAASAGAFVLLTSGGESIGFSSGRSRLDAELEGRRATPHFDIRYTRDAATGREMDAIAAAHEFHLADIAATLGVDRAGRITSYVFRGAADKKALTGSGGTNIAKPWLNEVYVNAEQFPYPTLRHEIAHVVLGRLVDTALRVPGRLGGLLPNIGVVEGAAVALEAEGAELTRHQGAKVLLLEKLLPDMAEVLSSSGFYRLPARRAYTAAGSFMLWLLETRGPGPFKAAYASGEIERAYGTPLGTLVAEWQKFLEAIPLDVRDRQYWAAPFKRPSIFGLTCAHEAAAARARASELSGRGRVAAAAEGYRALCARSCLPGDRRSLADALAKAGAHAEARAAYEALLREKDLEPYLRADVLDALGSLAWDAGDTGGAIRYFRECAVLHLDLGRRRSIDLRLGAVAHQDPLVRRKMQAFYSDDTDAAVRPVLLAEALAADPGYTPAAYLLGRHLFNRGEFAAAVPYLARAVVLPSDVIEREARKLLGICALLSGDTVTALKALGEARAGGAPSWVAHIRFLERMASSPLFAAGVPAPSK